MPATLTRCRALARSRALAIAVLGLAVSLPAALCAQERPRLVVLIVIDQFRYDYLVRFGRYFADGGFRRFMRDGATFSEARYHHATTDTCPGHAVIATGYWGDLNGIVANGWFDTARGRKVDCAAAGGTDRALNLLRPTIGDALKRATDGEARVIVASGKRSAAVMLGGQRADAVYFTAAPGRFTRLGGYAPLADWVRAFNDARREDSPLTSTWTRLLPADEYAIQGSDDVPAEAPPGDMGRTFPHALSAGFPGLGDSNHATFDNSPFADEVLVEFAMAALEKEGLGRDDVPDLLALSFSANDKVGHGFGPDSHEAMDTVVRTDRHLERLLDFLDDTVGLGRVLVVLTADHGVASLPEVAAARGRVPAGRIPEEVLSEAVSEALSEAYGTPGSGKWVAYHDFPNVYLDEKTVRAAGVHPEDAELVARRAIERLPGILSAYTRSELDRLKDTAVASPRVQMALLSFRADRSGHVVYQVLPNTVADAEGTNHGSHWNYDTHVPLMWLGAGVRPGRYVADVSPADIAPTVRAFLGLPPDTQAAGRVLRNLLPAEREPAGSPAGK